MSVFDACKPVRCPTTHLFDLDALLQASASLQEAEIQRLDAMAEGSEPGRLDGGEGPAAPTPPQPAQLPATAAPPDLCNAPGPSYQHRFRKRKRDDEIQAVGHVRRPKTLSTLVPHAVQAATPCRIDYIDLPATQGAYGVVVRRKKEKERTDEDTTTKEVPWEEKISRLEDRVYTLQEVQEIGVRVFPWDGINPVPFVDSDGRIFMVLAGRPIDKPGQKRPYSKACDAAYALLEKVGKDASFFQQSLSHRRGDYPVINVGVTHGMGTLRPTYLDVRPNNDIVEEVLSSQDIQRIASYGSASFALWFPKNYSYYKTNLDLLFEHTGLRRIFPKSVFPSAALNCGPGVCTKRHTDCKNCPFGVCTVTSLGRFNPKTGGHLILWELGIAVEFPPGSTILLPSATISHANTPIADGEVRASFTQYASGGLFRWVDYGYQTENDLKKNNPKAYREMLQLRPDRWKLGVGLYSTFAELKSWIF